jgi:site-specific DNA recombinase
VINRPRNAALRSRGRARPRKDDSRANIPFEIFGSGAEWEPIITEAEFYQAHAILSNPARRTRPGHPRTHLLSGIACCGLCSGKMSVSGGTSAVRKGDRVYRYVPRAVYRCRDCGKISRNQAYVDDLVVRTILNVPANGHGDGGPVGYPVETESVDHATAAKQLQDSRDRLNDAAQAYASNAINLDQLTTITAALRPMIERVETELAKLPQSNVRYTWEHTTEDWWAEMPISERRGIIAANLNIVINPSTKRGRGFDPSSVAISWK